jgi:hypothetical protein
MRYSTMKKVTITSVMLMAFPVAGMTATEQSTGSPAVPPIDQSHPGSTLSASENVSAKHLAAAAAHEQAAVHHKAAANAQQPEQAKEHAKAAEEASIVACEKSKEALASPHGN